MISIVIPAYNELDCTRQCVSSIVANTRCPYRLVLVDNGSTEPVNEFFQSVPGAIAIRSEENLGFAGGVNLGMRRAEGHVLLLNNDTLVPEGWLARMEAVLLSAPDIGMVGPMSNYVSGSQLIPDLSFQTLDEISAYAAQRRSDFSDSIRDVARLVGFCLLIRDTAAREVGLFDEAFGLGNFEDDDYCIRVLRAGYRIVVDEGSFVFHYGHRTFRALGLVGAEWESLLQENGARFGEKWQFKPEDRLDNYRRSLQMNRVAGETLARGDVAGALREYRDAIRLAPNLARNHNDLGVALWEAGVHDQAYARVKVALELDPTYIEARENLREMAHALDCEAEASAFLAGLPGEAPA